MLTGCSIGSKEKIMEGVLYKGVVPRKNADPDKQFLVYVDEAKCVGCDTCISYCPTGAIQGEPNKAHQVISPVVCIACGQCLTHCPMSAIHEEVSYVEKVARMLKDPDVLTIASPAPAVRYALAECFGAPVGTTATGKMIAALKKLGFKRVWDTEFGADLTIWEEGTELIGRLTGTLKKPLPQFTSCCPAWIKYVETFHPEILPHLSSAKSPVSMVAALSKTYGAEKAHILPKKVFFVSIMPCIAKKYEGMRPELSGKDGKYIDATITTRELAWLIKHEGINFNALPEETPDDLMGDSTGGATIFGVTGGTLEAALRFAYQKVTGLKPQSMDFTAVRGMKGVREATIKMGALDVKIAVVNGLKYAHPICEQVKNGTSPYQFIEVMTCPGGCVNGGGQPIFPNIIATIRRGMMDFFHKFAVRLDSFSEKPRV